MTALRSVADALAMKVSIMRLLKDVRHDEETREVKHTHVSESHRMLRRQLLWMALCWKGVCRRMERTGGYIRDFI